MPATAGLGVWRRRLCICAFRSMPFKGAATIRDPGGPPLIPAPSAGEMKEELLARGGGEEPKAVKSCGGGRSWPVPKRDALSHHGSGLI